MKLNLVVIGCKALKLGFNLNTISTPQQFFGLVRFRGMGNFWRGRGVETVCEGFECFCKCLSRYFALYLDTPCTRMKRPETSKIKHKSVLCHNRVLFLVSNNRYEVCSLKPCQKCITPKHFFLELPFSPGRVLLDHSHKGKSIVQEKSGERGWYTYLEETRISE